MLPQHSPAQTKVTQLSVKVSLSVSLGANMNVSPLLSSSPPASSARGPPTEPGASFPPPPSTFLPSSVFIPLFCSGVSSTLSVPAGFLPPPVPSLFLSFSPNRSQLVSLSVSVRWNPTAAEPTNQPTERATEPSRAEPREHGLIPDLLWR